ncbi:MAG TPA: ATP-binding protein [Ktedonosporobacter sp.]|nr:ATP-binding protein [Ktedonosporobacter sp.]
MAVLSPLTWWLARVMTERLFFSEIRHHRRIIEQPNLLDDEILDVEGAARLLTVAAEQTFEIPRVCLFVLDESYGSYRVFPKLKDGSEDAPRRSLIKQFLGTVQQDAPHEDVDWLDMELPVLDRLAASRRPMLLSEATRAREEAPGILSRYVIATNPLAEDHVLLAPIRAQGKMIGLLVLGERSDHQQYAGPDFEIAQLLITRYSSVLESSRLYAKGHQHAQLLNNLYNASAMMGYAFKSLEEISFAYAEVAAEAVEGRAEMWLLEGKGKEQVVRCVHSVGSGPRLTQCDNLQLESVQDWLPCFYGQDNGQKQERSSALFPSCVSAQPAFPFAWLPLLDGEKRLGIFILTYPRPHLFVNEEIRLLGMFAGQCSAALENARMTIELQQAYERQKELDRLKDQFIMIASHELRTPLTAVQGYIELLHEYNTTLTPETRASFIGKAHRGCDELVLLVGNIMDASRVQADAQNVKLRPLVLVESIVHVMEILEAITRREQRKIAVSVPSGAKVMGDDMRLRQVLLNLFNNALKYSPAETDIEVTARIDQGWVTVGVRDYGAGVPPAEQGRLFERFMRLERDMNSPTRGSGLGLYICKQLVEAMGGQLWVESSGCPGEGSFFAFTLQLAPESPGEAGQQEYLSSDASGY